MRKVSLKVLTFNELNEAIQKTIIENFRDINVDTEYNEPLFDKWKETLESMGFENPKILYSGFGSQGDGACFTCERIDFEKYADGKYKELDLTGKITHQYRYYFASSTNVSLDSGENVSSDQHLKIEAEIEAERTRIGNQIYVELETLYYQLISDEAVRETIQANEWEFLPDGKMYNEQLESA